MRIKLKIFDESENFYKIVGQYDILPSIEVRVLKEIISSDIKRPSSQMHFETTLNGIKILMTESFPLSFFFPQEDYGQIYLEFNQKPKKTMIDEAFAEAMLAVQKGDLIKLKSIFTSSIKIQVELCKRRHSNGWSLLHLASFSGRPEIISFLSGFNTNLNEETKDHWTPLMLACAHGQGDCTKILLKHRSIEVNKLTFRGSALHLAVAFGHCKIVELLLINGASMMLEDYNGRIPLQLAQDKDIIELLPKFQGNSVLCRCENKDNLPTFAGKLKLYKSHFLKNKNMFAIINLERGTFDEFKDKHAYFNKNPPIHMTKLVEIIRCEALQGCWPHRSYFFFEIVTKEKKRIYYGEHTEIRDEWVKNIVDSVKYCQIHKIGVDNSNQLFTVIEQEPHDVIEQIDKSEIATLDMFERVSEIGSGSYGIVYKVVKKDTQAVYAMKCLSKYFLNKSKMLDYAISEINIMKSLSHPFILKLHYSFTTNSSIYLILEYCEKGDLELRKEKGPIPEIEAKFYIAEMILGLEYLHSKDIMYRDLKPGNVLVDSQGHIKLADFGLARSIDDKLSIVSTVVGSPAYISPEIISREKLSKASDLYSLGVAIHELLSGVIPFSENEIDKLFNQIKESRFTIHDSLGKEAQNLVKKLLNRKPSKRPKIQDIKSHPFFNNINWELLYQKRYLPPVVGEIIDL